MLGIFGQPGLYVTIITRLITLCVHIRSQFSHFSDEMLRFPPIAISSYGSSRHPMLPIESKSVQRVFFGIRRDYRGDVAEAGHPARAGYRGPPGTGGDAVS